MFRVTAWLAIATPLVSKSTVVKELATGPYELPLASCQVSDAVSVRLPAGCPAGTGNAADAEALAPDAIVAGTPVTVPLEPLGTVSVTTRPVAVAPPVSVNERGLVSLVPAAIVEGPDLAIETIGRCSTVVTGEGGAAVMVPVDAVPVADAVAFNGSPSTAANEVKYDESVCPLPFAGGAGTLNVPVTDAEAPGATVASADLLLGLN